MMVHINGSSRKFLGVCTMVAVFLAAAVLSATTLSAFTFIGTSTRPRMTSTASTSVVPSLSSFISEAKASTATTSQLHASAASPSTSTTTKYYLEEGDPVLLVGPGLLQLVLARHLYHEGLRPIIVASQSQLDSFFANLLKEDNLDPEEYAQLLEDSTIGMPEVDDPYFGELKGVVFCAEDAVLPPEFVSRVLDFEDQDESAYEEEEPLRVICCLPVSNKVQKEKSNSWIPIFNNDQKQQETWTKFEQSYKSHKCMSKGGCGSIVRFGSLFGGSTDGPPSLELFGLDEGMYKVRSCWLGRFVNCN